MVLLEAGNLRDCSDFVNTSKQTLVNDLEKVYWYYRVRGSSLTVKIPSSLQSMALAPAESTILGLRSNYVPHIIVQIILVLTTGFIPL